MRAFTWFLGLIAAALAAIAAFTYPAWLLLHPRFGFPFHRIGERIGMLALLAGFLLVARRLKLADRGSLGYGLARRDFLRELGIGAALGVATMLAVVGIMSLLGLSDWSAATRTRGAALAGVIGARALSALAVALIEETFLR
ncbi:MAG: twin-arginine translocation signal domain-containing protein, partial [Steroidobacteraceae bacterium]